MVVSAVCFQRRTPSVKVVTFSSYSIGGSLAAFFAVQSVIEALNQSASQAYRFIGAMFSTVIGETI